MVLPLPLLLVPGVLDREVREVWLGASFSLHDDNSTSNRSPRALWRAS